MCGTNKRLFKTKSAALEVIKALFSGVNAKSKLYFEIENKIFAAGVVRLEIPSTKFNL